MQPHLSNLPLRINSCSCFLCKAFFTTEASQRLPPTQLPLAANYGSTHVVRESRKELNPHLYKETLHHLKSNKDCPRSIFDKIYDELCLDQLEVVKNGKVCIMTSLFSL